MGEFNLLYQPWISVMKNRRGETEVVSIIDLFKNADEYIDLSGDSRTQDFAVLRILLAILHTVYSRYDFNNQSYTGLDVDDMMRQLYDMDEDDEDYQDELMETWEKLWQKGQFTEILYDYFDKWQDRFYLFDEDYPFFQVREEDIDVSKISKKKASSISGKTLNRRVSESGNKIALFSPKSVAYKDILTEAELARWIITFQGYSGLSDKTIFGEEKYKASKGWLFDLGGIYLKGGNLFETLLLNLVLVNKELETTGIIQKPSWENESESWIERHFDHPKPDNIAELYTRWSRAIYIDPKINIEKAFSCAIVKLPEIDHVGNFLEPMTMWRRNKSGDNKDQFTPRKHTPQQAVWRSFGLITLPSSMAQDEDQIRPGVISWLDEISYIISDYDLSIQSVSMRDDGNATSWMPIDEIVDTLRINDLVLSDTEQEGWVVRITDMVDQTKKVISHTFRSFLVDIREIRNLDSKHPFVSEGVESLYYEVDVSFREWLAALRPEHSKEEKMLEWKSILKQITLKEADKHMENAGSRDYLGVPDQDKQKNIITAHNRFVNFLNKFSKEA